MKNKIAIWGTNIPYNRPGILKKDLLCVGDVSKEIARELWVNDIFGTSVAKDSVGLDTYGFFEEIESGKVSKYMDDVPTLTPFICPGADAAIIIAPGGGFCIQDRENEGYAIARKLNENGISAFVLEYRMNPYEAPVCYLDMQRAIRYVRFHSSDFGLREDRIGAMGFSAGGYVAGASAILLGNQMLQCEDYAMDEIDSVDGIPSFLGLIYPVTNFDYNPNILAYLAGDDYFDDSKRRGLQKKYSLTANLSTSSIPQFLCYGDKDPLGGMDEYDAKLNELGIDHKTLIIKGASHGFSLADKRYSEWINEFIVWVKKLLQKNVDR